MKIKDIVKSRGGRAAVVAIPVGIVSAVLMGGVAQGAVPVSFSVSGTSFTMAGSQLLGEQFSQYGGYAKLEDGTEIPVAIANIGDAKIADLCQEIVTDTPLGKVGMVITAGKGGNPVTATNLQIGMTNLAGDAVFSNVRIGTDAGQVVTSAKGSGGDFAMDSDAITLTDFSQVAYTTTAGTLALTGMELKVVTDGSGCGE
ncbi:DUF6230 family protein [Microbacterium sp. NPDC096154]|uniref:DUF6230 family protein n=1 Tax=Microbacterium sp. NPDC096154 TaxID=3155549 RepID=UPI00332EE3BB